MVQVVERTDCCELGESGVKLTFSVVEGGVSRAGAEVVEAEAKGA